MGKILYLNNFECPFIDAVKDVPTTVTPATELNYGILRLNNMASGVLVNPTGGDYYLLTAFKRASGAESAFEVMKVTEVDITTHPGECRIKVARAQEGTSAKAYVTGDLVQLRWTKGSAESMQQAGDKDASGGIPGLTLFKLNLRNALNTATSWFTTAATAARTWTMPDKDGTVAMLSDITSGGQAGSFTTLSASGDTTLGDSAEDTVTINASRIRGDFSNATLANRPHFQNVVDNQTTSVGILPSGTATTAQLNIENNSDPANGQYFQFISSALASSIVCGARGTNSANLLPLIIQVGGAERLRVATYGAVTIPGTLSLTGASSTLGYGTGSGGTVTQANNRSDPVTLNRSTGKITTVGNSLAAGASASFTFYNSLIGVNDVVLLTSGAGSTMDVKASDPVDGSVVITVKNITGVALPPVIPINFVIIKGSVA